MYKVYWHWQIKPMKTWEAFNAYLNYSGLMIPGNLTQPEDRDHFKPDITGFEMVKVKMEAGDLLIFNSLQPHGIRAEHEWQ